MGTMEYTKKYNIPGILVSLDVRKAFDSIEWPFIMRTLDVFNFGIMYYVYYVFKTGLVHFTLT